MRGRQTLHMLTDRGLLRALRGDEGGVGGHVFESPSLLSHGNSCALLPRVLESLLVSLVTTVVVFVASMVLGECRQISSSSQIGNDSFLLQVSPEHLLASSYAYKKNPEMQDVPPFQANGCVGFKRERNV